MVNKILKASLTNIRGDSEIYANGLTSIPLHIRNAFGINEENYKKYKVIWLVCADGSVIIKFEEI